VLPALSSDLANDLKELREPGKLFSSAEPRIWFAQDKSLWLVQCRQNVKVSETAILCIHARHEGYVVLLISYRLNNPAQCLSPVGCGSGYEDGHEFARSKTQLGTPFSSTLDSGQFVRK